MWKDDSISWLNDNTFIGFFFFSDNNFISKNFRKNYFEKKKRERKEKFCQDGVPRGMDEKEWKTLKEREEID